MRRTRAQHSPTTACLRRVLPKSHHGYTTYGSRPPPHFNTNTTLFLAHLLPDRPLDSFVKQLLCDFQVTSELSGTAIGQVFAIEVLQTEMLSRNAGESQRGGACNHLQQQVLPPPCSALSFGSDQSSVGDPKNLALWTRSAPDKCQEALYSHLLDKD